MIASPQEHNIISVSGGKDSTALVLLAIEREVENLQFVFADIADRLQRRFGGSQTLVADHHGVRIETTRPHVAHWNKEA